MSCGCGSKVRSRGPGKVTVTRLGKVAKSIASHRIPSDVMAAQAVRQNELEQGTSALEKKRKLTEIRKKIIAQKLGH